MKTDSRIYSIDSLRFVAAFGVICLHFQPFAGISYKLSVLIEQLMYFAVPFFFITSGYLFRKKIIDEDKNIGRYSNEIATDPLYYLFVAGTSTHLWYLVALAMALSMLFLFIKLGIEEMFLFFSCPHVHLSPSGWTLFGNTARYSY